MADFQALFFKKMTTVYKSNLNLTYLWQYFIGRKYKIVKLIKKFHFFAAAKKLQNTRTTFRFYSFIL